ncbi:hypothetical protein CVT24_000140 [Panaeolus cyanescens]|uniref:Uncharacterized protein n=1 Tax=Panaeolus cyanescens TaxID=181874 RepID=A0A409VSD4_9AGAR|nr:hypothetical protein CVT24_000140 [Panaeolus cyanescens]
MPFNTATPALISGKLDGFCNKYFDAYDFRYPVGDKHPKAPRPRFLVEFRLKGFDQPTSVPMEWLANTHIDIVTQYIQDGDKAPVWREFLTKDVGTPCTEASILFMRVTTKQRLLYTTVPTRQTTAELAQRVAIEYHDRHIGALRGVNPADMYLHSVHTVHDGKGRETIPTDYYYANIQIARAHPPANQDYKY